MHGISKEGILGTIIFHIILLLIILFIKIYTSSSSAGEGILLVDFQSSGGTTQLYEQKNYKQPEIAEEKDDKMLTQDYEEAPVVKEVTKEKKRKETEKEKKVEDNKVEEIEKPQIDQRRLFRRDLITDRQGTGTGEGIGNADGSGKGSGGGGEGADFGGGEGTSMSYSLEGRGKVYLHEPPKIFTTSGIVVVEIIVDRDGNVISAREGIKGTTTTDAMLLKLAKEAALKSKFTSNPDAPVHQKGTITYYFKLR